MEASFYHRVETKFSIPTIFRRSKQMQVIHNVRKDQLQGLERHQEVQVVTFIEVRQRTKLQELLKVLKNVYIGDYIR